MTTKEAKKAGFRKAKHKPCDMPDEMTFNGVKCHRLSDDEQHKDGDIPVDGSQTHRFGSVWYRPVESHETPLGETQAKEVVTDETQPKVGNKYHRTIHGVIGGSIVVDVYNVIDAFGVTCPACQHAIKKLLCAGLRNKGSRLQDLSEAAESASRAVTLEKQREQ